MFHSLVFAETTQLTVGVGRVEKPLRVPLGVTYRPEVQNNEILKTFQACNLRHDLPKIPTPMKAMKQMMKRMRQMTSVQDLVEKILTQQL